MIEAIEGYGFDTVSEIKSIEQLESQQRNISSRSSGQSGSSYYWAIGIANIMIVGILEHRGDIGVMKVVGMLIAKIWLMFLIESAIIGFEGGIAGILVSNIIV